MNPIAKWDSGMVFGHFKGLGATDSDVLRSHHMQLKTSLELFRKLLLIPLVIGIIMAAVGTVGLVVLIGAFLYIPAVIFGGGAWWARKRLRENRIALEAGFIQYTKLLQTSATAPST